MIYPQAAFQPGLCQQLPGILHKSACRGIGKTADGRGRGGVGLKYIAGYIYAARYRMPVQACVERCLGIKVLLLRIKQVGIGADIPAEQAVAAFQGSGNGRAEAVSATRVKVLRCSRLFSK